jgi:hypothetical protein
LNGVQFEYNRSLTIRHDCQAEENTYGYPSRFHLFTYAFWVFWAVKRTSWLRSLKEERSARAIEPEV